MKPPWIIFAPLVLLAVALAGCTSEGMIEANQLEKQGSLVSFTLTDGNGTVKGVNFSLHVSEERDVLERIEDAVNRYNTALIGMNIAQGQEEGFDAHSARFMSITGSLEEHKAALIAALNNAKHDPNPYPTWAELDGAIGQVEEHYQDVLNTAGKDVAASFRQEAETFDEERRSLAGHLALYGLPAVPLAAGLAWGLTHVWERKQRYWGSFTSQKLFSDPRLIMVGLSISSLAIVGIGLLALEFTFGGVWDLISFLLPW